MANQLEIHRLLEEVQKIATAGFALALHVRFTTPTFLFQTYDKEWLDYYSQNGFVMSDGFVAQIGLRSDFPLPQTDLVYGHGTWYAEGCEAI